MNELLNKHRAIKRVMNLLIVVYAAFLLMHVWLTGESMWLNLGCSAALVAAMTVRHIGEPYRWIGYGLPFIEFALIALMFYGGSTDILNFILMLFSLDLIVYHDARFGVPFTLAGYFAYALLWKESQGDTMVFFVEFLNFALFVAAVWGAKVLLKQRDTIYGLNRKILEQSTVMEELAALKERNRIAEEVHNTVGPPADHGHRLPGGGTSAVR